MPAADRPDDVTASSHRTEIVACLRAADHFVDPRRTNRDPVRQEHLKKGNSHPTNDVSLNTLANASIRDVIDAVATRRCQFVKGGVGAALAAAGGLTLSGLVSRVQAAPVAPGLGFPGIGFERIPASTPIVAGTGSAVADMVKVPTGHTAQLFVAWGDPIMPGGAPFTGTASETAADQLKLFGAHSDGMHFFPMAGADGRPSRVRGILCVNNKYPHKDILLPDGQVGASGYTIDKRRKSQAAHGVSIVEARKAGGK